MESVILPDAAAVAARAADELSSALAAARAAGRGVPAIALPTGNTPLPLYRELARRRRDEDWMPGIVRCFGLDELILPAAHPARFAQFLETQVWEPLGWDRDLCDVPDGAAADLTAECHRYDAALAATGDLDLAVLGVGADGHVAYNQPGAVEEASHVVTLPETVAAGIEVPAGWRPLRALTVGMATLRGAQRLLLLATGAAKRQALSRLLEGPADPCWPVSLLREHPAFTVLADAAAVGRLA